MAPNLIHAHLKLTLKALHLVIIQGEWIKVFTDLVWKVSFKAFQRLAELFYPIMSPFWECQSLGEWLDVFLHKLFHCWVYCLGIWKGIFGFLINRWSSFNAWALRAPAHAGRTFRSGNPASVRTSVSCLMICMPVLEPHVHLWSPTWPVH